MNGLISALGPMRLLMFKTQPLRTRVYTRCVEAADGLLGSLVYA